MTRREQQRVGRILRDRGVRVDTSKLTEDKDGTVRYRRVKIVELTCPKWQDQD